MANNDEKVKVRKVGPLYFVDQNGWGRQLKAGLPQDKQEGSEEEPSRRKMENATSLDILLSQGYYIAWPARRTNIPGLVDEEEEPLEVANCGVAEI